MRKKFPEIPMGISDHTPDLLSSIVGVSLGAKIIEKHFVHDKKKVVGPDINASIDEKQLKDLINVVDRTYKQLKGNKTRLREEQITRNFAFASVISLKEIKKGEKFSKKNLWVKRPGTGYFNSDQLLKLYGKVAKKRIKENTQLKKTDVI